MINTKSYYLVLIGLLLLLYIFATSFLLQVPPVWSDEGVNADIAFNLLNEGRLGTDLWQGLLKGVETFGFGFPPLFYYIKAGWIGLFGFTIESQRQLSIAFSLIFIVIYFKFTYRLLQTIFKTPNKIALFMSAIAGFLLITDNTFLKAAKLARPEIIILTFGLLSVLFFVKSLDEKKSFRRKITFTVLSGLLCGINVLIHYSAAVFILAIVAISVTIGRSGIIKSKAFYVFSLAAFIPIFLWLITLIPSWELFLTQARNTSGLKGVNKGYLYFIFISDPFIYKLEYLMYIAITGIYFVFAYLKRTPKYYLVAWLLAFSWLFALYWKHEWIYVLPVPFIYLALSILAAEFYAKPSQAGLINSGRQLAVLAVAAMGLINLILFNGNLNSFRGDNYSYAKYSQGLLSLIPDRKTVYMSAVPDPYFVFKNGRNNKLYEFPMFPVSKESYLAILHQSHFIIYNQSLDGRVVGNYLKEYIKANALNAFLVGDRGQYQAIVFEMKPEGKRIIPNTDGYFK